MTAAANLGYREVCGLNVFHHLESIAHFHTTPSTPLCNVDRSNHSARMAARVFITITVEVCVADEPTALRACWGRAGQNQRHNPPQDATARDASLHNAPEWTRVDESRCPPCATSERLAANPMPDDDQWRPDRGGVQVGAVDTRRLVEIITDPEQVEQWQARYGGRDTYHDGLWITFDGDTVIVHHDDG